MSYDEDVDLSKWDKDYQDAEEPSGGDYPDLPDGKYVGRIESVQLKNSKAGNEMFVTEFVIAGGEHDGRKLWKHNVLITSENVKYLKADLIRCGLQLDKLSDLKLRLKELLDRHVKLTLKTKAGKEQQTYINGLTESTRQPNMGFKGNPSPNVPTQGGYDESDPLPF
jgi:hypothetical protein